MSKPAFELKQSEGGTSLQGYVTTSFANLKKILGEPNSTGDEYKVSTEWNIVFADGTVATIYDWKLTTMYDDDGLTVAQVRTASEIEWHIGGVNHRAVELVGELLDLRARTFGL
jgi:hypothetical protein